MAFSDYRDRYDAIRLDRDDRGVLELTMHTDGGPWQMSRASHDQLVDAFREIAGDPDVELVIFTGTGEEFSGPRGMTAKPSGTAGSWEKRRWLGAQLMDNYLSIPVPIIAAINGPAYRQAQIPLLADIVIAADTAAFQDSAHFPNNVVPGDSINIAMLSILGLNRGRYFLLMGQTLDAAEAKDLGLVSEVMPLDELLPRARQIADELMGKTSLVRRYTRLLGVHELKRQMHDVFGYGLALEGLAVIDRADPEAG